MICRVSWLEDTFSSRDIWIQVRTLSHRLQIGLTVIKLHIHTIVTRLAWFVFKCLCGLNCYQKLFNSSLLLLLWS